MNILVIGNGFDLAHHFPTQYRDFLDFIKAFIEPNDSDYSAFIENIKLNNESLYLEIESLINPNVLIEYFLSIYEERCKKGKKGWIDFENEISFIVQKLDEAKQYIIAKTTSRGDPVELEKGLFRDLEPIIAAKKDTGKVGTWHLFLPSFFDYQATRVLDALSRLTRLLEIYFFEYIEKQDCEYRLSDIQNLGIDHVLSFNYTDTYRKLYDSESKAQHCYIHGKAKDGSVDTCNLVLGIDEYLSSDRRDNDNQFVWFKKFYQRIYKETSSEYIDWLDTHAMINEGFRKLKPEILDIYFYGHSLDITDKDVLRKLILHENARIHIFYRDKGSMAKQISNLVKIIGEENLIRMTGGKDRSILFEKITVA